MDVTYAETYDNAAVAVAEQKDQLNWYCTPPLPTTSECSLSQSIDPPMKKRLRSDDDGDYITMVGKEMKDFLDQFPISSSSSYTTNNEKTLESKLEHIEQNVTCIKSSLEKKRSKVTLHDVNEKVDLVIELLKSLSLGER